MKTKFKNNGAEVTKLKISQVRRDEKSQRYRRRDRRSTEQSETKAFGFLIPLIAISFLIILIEFFVDGCNISLAFKIVCLIALLLGHIYEWNAWFNIFPSVYLIIWYVSGLIYYMKQVVENDDIDLDVSSIISLLSKNFV